MRKWLVILTVSFIGLPSASWAQAQQMQSPQEAPPKSMGMEFAKGLVSPVLSVVYFPVKLAVGISGAVLGGVSGWATGGNQRAAEGIWRPLTGGTYFITPQVIDGERPFLPFDGGSYTHLSSPPSAPVVEP